MPKILTDAQSGAYARDGFVFPIKVMDEPEARTIRGWLEAVEGKSGGALSGALRFKPHILHPFLDDLVRHPLILDAVEDVIGPDVLCWASSFFTKEAQDSGYVAWHQDSTYWGLSKPDVLTAWIALSPSTPESGCMQVIPGTHTQDQLPHRDTDGTANMLSRGQEIQVDVDESRAVGVVLRPGEISLHNVRLIHGSKTNNTDDRRIGFAVRYIPTDVRQLNGPHDSASLVRGADRFHNFEDEPRPAADMHPDAVAWHAKAAANHGALLFQGSDRQPYS